MEPTWGPPGSCRPQMCPMLAPWTLLSGLVAFVTRIYNNCIDWLETCSATNTQTSFHNNLILLQNKLFPKTMIKSKYSNRKPWLLEALGTSIRHKNKGAAKPQIDLYIDGHKITESSETKFVGIFIDNNLAWKYHINYISGKIAKGIGIITKARRLLDKESSITLYYSFIYPYLWYCYYVWGNTFLLYLDKLYKMQKKIVRIIAGARPRIHSEPFFKKYEILNIAEINKYLIRRFIYHVHNKMYSLLCSLNPVFRIEVPFYGIICWAVV